MNKVENLLKWQKERYKGFKKNKKEILKDEFFFIGTCSEIFLLFFQSKLD